MRVVVLLGEGLVQEDGSCEAFDAVARAGSSGLLVVGPDCSFADAFESSRAELAPRLQCNFCFADVIGATTPEALGAPSDRAAEPARKRARNGPGAGQPERLVSGSHSPIELTRAAISGEGGAKPRSGSRVRVTPAAAPAAAATRSGRGGDSDNGTRRVCVEIDASCATAGAHGDDPIEEFAGWLVDWALGRDDPGTAADGARSEIFRDADVTVVASGSAALLSRCAATIVSHTQNAEEGTACIVVAVASARQVRVVEGALASGPDESPASAVDGDLLGGPVFEALQAREAQRERRARRANAPRPGQSHALASERSGGARDAVCIAVCGETRARVDPCTSFSASECASRGGLGVSHARFLPREIGFWCGKVPKYGA